MSNQLKVRIYFIKAFVTHSVRSRRGSYTCQRKAWEMLVGFGPDASGSRISDAWGTVRARRRIQTGLKNMPGATSWQGKR